MRRAHPGEDPESADPQRITVHVDPTAKPALSAGTSTLALANGQEGLLYVPPGELRALVVLLHGAGGSAAAGLQPLLAQADGHGLVLLAPASRSSTWAAITGSSDVDTLAVAAAMETVLARHPFAPGQLVVGGFSDGASYALTLGLANGDVFGHIVAFSPGFETAHRRRGQPRIYLSHGTGDRVLPIDRTSRRLRPALERAGYPLTYREFDGGHVVPDAIAEEASLWLSG